MKSNAKKLDAIRAPWSFQFIGTSKNLVKMLSSFGWTDCTDNEAYSANFTQYTRGF